jgi:hypothetical protein
MRSNLELLPGSRSAAGFVPFWSLEIASFGDPEKRLTGVDFLGLSPTAMPNSSDSTVVADATFLPQTLVVQLSGEQTNGSMVVITNSTPPQSGPPLIVIGMRTRCFWSWKGRFGSWLMASGRNRLEPGTVVYTPRGVVHTFQNVGETPSRQLVIGTPSGFELFFSKSAEIFAAAEAGGPPDMARILAISEEHGIEFVPPLAIG